MSPISRKVERGDCTDFMPFLGVMLADVELKLDVELVVTDAVTP